jgi:hypothetical protein
MTIPKHFCRVCGARATHQNLCDKPTCLSHARQVEVIKRDMSRLGWVATKEMVLEHCRTQLPILRLTGTMNQVQERKISLLIIEVKAALFDDVTTIVNNHPHAAKLLKLPLIKLPPPAKPIPRVFYMDTDSVVTDAPLGTPYEELVKAFGEQRIYGHYGNANAAYGKFATSPRLGDTQDKLKPGAPFRGKTALEVNSAYGKRSIQNESLIEESRIAWSAHRPCLLCGLFRTVDHAGCCPTCRKLAQGESK